jgi:hypothetical protein
MKTEEQPWLTPFKWKTLPSLIWRGGLPAIGPVLWCNLKNATPKART